MCRLDGALYEQYLIHCAPDWINIFEYYHGYDVKWQVQNYFPFYYHIDYSPFLLTMIRNLIYRMYWEI